MTERLGMARSFLSEKGWKRVEHAAWDQRFNACRWQGPRGAESGPDEGMSAQPTREEPAS